MSIGLMLIFFKRSASAIAHEDRADLGMCFNVGPWSCGCCNVAELSLEGNEMLPTALFELTELSEWANVVVTGCEHEAPLFVAVNGNWFEPGQGF
jgi:hypothetical protein